jgi:hypothetical protein
MKSWQQPKHGSGLEREQSGNARHHARQRGPTFFRSGGYWYRDDGHGNQWRATDLIMEQIIRSFNAAIRIVG